MRLATYVCCLVTMLLGLSPSTATAEVRHPMFIDGAQVIPRGFVVVTEDSEPVQYTADDYQRMVRMGANWQVVRLALGRLGGYPGAPVEEGYLDQVQALVAMGRQAGLRTSFKMTAYSVAKFSWGDFWRDQHHEQDRLVAAWKLVWERFRDDPSVMGYDLLNEPLIGDMDLEPRVVEREHLVPLLHRLVAESQAINPAKLCFYQPILLKELAEMQGVIPFLEMTTPMEGANLVFAPHIYEFQATNVQPTFERYLKEAARSGAGIFIGEWGCGTFSNTDTNLGEQQRYQTFYIETARCIDELGLPSIKAWFTGTRKFLGSGDKRFTWSVFQDPEAVGTAERKYITDIICRPYPQQIAGKLEAFSFDFPTRTLAVRLQPGGGSGLSKIYVPVDRHYPDGFSLLIGDDTIYQYSPLREVGLECVAAPDGFDGSNVTWDAARQQVVISHCPAEARTLKIVPGLKQKINARNRL